MLTREASHSDTERWDAYVRSSPVGLPQHLYAWRNVLNEVYGYKTHYVVAEENGECRGLLPLFTISSVLVGRTVTTMPGGLCANDEQAAQALIEAGVEFARQENAKRFVVHDSRSDWSSELESTCGHEAWIIDVRDGEDAVWNGLHRNIRRQVRKGRNNELTVAIDRSDRLLDDFYHVLCQFAHEAGTPAFGRRFIESVIQHFPDGFDIEVVYSQDKPIAGYFQLEMDNTVYGVWGAALRDYFTLSPVYLAYWSILEYAMNNGFEYLDMGRAPLGSNASSFKGQWNGSPVPVYQQSLTLRGAKHTGSAATQAQEDSGFKLVRQVWPKLPYPVVQVLGPRLRRHIPFA